MSYAGRQSGDATTSTTSTAPFMRTAPSEFCQAFDDDPRPGLGPVLHAAEARAGGPAGGSASRVLPALRGLRHQSQRLVDKVAVLQAYVLICVPIKRGKSWCMNASS